jgi:hypothetical protein
MYASSQSNYACQFSCQLLTLMNIDRNAITCCSAAQAYSIVGAWSHSLHRIVDIFYFLFSAQFGSFHNLVLFPVPFWLEGPTPPHAVQPSSASEIDPFRARVGDVIADPSALVVSLPCVYFPRCTDLTTVSTTCEGTPPIFHCDFP